MLPRRHIRVKIFQSLYIYSQKNKDKKFNINKAYNQNLKEYLNLYCLIIEFLRIIHELAKEEITIRQSNLMPTQEDLKPNKRFINNKILKKIKEYQIADIDYIKLKSILKNIFRNIKKSTTYLKYMDSKTSSNESDTKIIIYILKKHLVINEKIHEFIEEYSIYWNDDLIIVYNHIIEKLNKLENIQTTKLFRHKEDELFAKKLLTESIKQEQKVNEIIYNLAKNWDKERIALTDLILMKMGITEMMCIKNIPHKVSLDEYIEISKEYSTPKSKEFINGILDKFVKDILLKN